MRRIVSCGLSIILVLTFMLSLTGCSDSKKFVGQWKAEVDITDSIYSAMSDENEDVFKHVTPTDLTVSFVFAFNSDGTYRITVDEEAWKETMRTFGQTMAEGLRAYFQDLIVSSGLDVSVDELLESTGVDLDSMVDEMVGELESSELFGEDSISEGSFKAEKGKLYTSDSINSEIDENEYTSYTIEGDSIIFTGAVEAEFIDMEDMDIELFPMTLTKIG